MSSRFIMPFADVGGGIKPSSGAQLFFFETDGVTPKNTFNDQLSTPTPNANPVISDSNGVFGDIYITGTYKVTLEDKNGSQIFGGAIVEEMAAGNLTDSLISDLSQAYTFTTVAAYKAFTKEFPVGKRVYLTDRGAYFNVITGTGTATGNGIIASTSIDQSIEIQSTQKVAASMFGITGVGDETAVTQEFFDYSATKKELILDVTPLLDVGLNSVQDTDPNPTIGDTSNAAIIINHPIKIVSAFGVKALTGTGVVGNNNYLLSTNSEEIHLEFEIDGDRLNVNSSYGIQINNNDVNTKFTGGNFDGSPVVCNGASLAEKLTGIIANHHTYEDIGNTLFLRYTKGIQANNWTIDNVSEGLDVDKTCEGGQCNNWTVSTTRGGGADAALELNAAHGFQANEWVVTDFKQGIILNAKTISGDAFITRTEDCHADDWIIIRPEEDGIVYGNTTGDHSDCINCTTKNAIIIDPALKGIEISGTNVSCAGSIVTGGAREGILCRGGTVDAKGVILKNNARQGILHTGGVCNADHAVIENNNTAVGGYHGVDITSGNGEISLIGTKIKGAHEYGLRSAGTPTVILGSNDCSGELQSSFRFSSTTAVVQLAEARATVEGDVTFGGDVRTYWAPKAYVVSSSLAAKLGDRIMHTDASAPGDFIGRVCYDETPGSPLFRSFGVLA